MKVAGLAEVESALARLRRLHALGRIRSKDKNYIETHLIQIRDRVRTMWEKDEEGQVIPDATEAAARDS